MGIVAFGESVEDAEVAIGYVLGGLMVDMFGAVVEMVWYSRGKIMEMRDISTRCRMRIFDVGFGYGESFEDFFTQYAVSMFVFKIFSVTWAGSTL